MFFSYLQFRENNKNIWYSSKGLLKQAAWSRESDKFTCQDDLSK